MSLNESGNAIYATRKLWEDLLEIQLLELREALDEGDYPHAAEELADVVSVSNDMFRLFFCKDAIFEINKRMVKNLEKWTEKARYSNDWQEKKLSALRQKFGIEVRRK